MHRHCQGGGRLLQDCSFWNSQWIKAAAAMAINYSICFPYCLSLLISVALRRCCTTSASARMLQRDARALGRDEPPALLCSGRLGGGSGAEAPPEPRRSEQPARQGAEREAVPLGRRAKHVPPGRARERCPPAPSCLCCRARSGKRSRLRQAPVA